MHVLTPAPLSLDVVVAVARSDARVELGADARRAMDAARATVAAAAASDRPIYGVNTGFGSPSRHRIAPEETRAVQRNLLRSHAAGIGAPLPRDVVRAMMLLLAASLARGRSGARPVVVEALAAMLTAGVTPVIPSRGSVGASGDLAPLAHLALVLIGEGAAEIDGAIMPGADALARAGIAPVVLEAKEGLALINGTHLMTAMGALALHDIGQLCAAALGSAAMAIDACMASDAYLDARLHEARRQPGQIGVALWLRKLLAGSEILPAHRENDPRVQDPYCLRAAPQVIGAAFDAIERSRTPIEYELGAVTDNPLVFDDGAIVSGGNFHGMPIAIAMDEMVIALAPIAGIAERRIYWLLEASDGVNPVHPHLSPQPGLHSGLMIAQYTAAACCNEIQTLCTPASVANIPTSAGIEDYNSFGPTSGHQLRSAVDLARTVIAIEYLVMAEAMEYHRPLKSGAGVERLHDAVRAIVPRLTEDRPPAPDIAAIDEWIRTNPLWWDESKLIPVG